MKIKFSRTVVYIPEWNGNRSLPQGDQIICTIKPMVLGDLVILLDVLGGMTNEDGTKTNLTAAEATKMIEATKDILPKYVEMTGLEDDDGPVSVDQMTMYAQYMPLASEIIMACANISSPGQSTEGNLNAPQG
jgi:hypothetical protein